MEQAQRISRLRCVLAVSMLLALLLLLRDDSLLGGGEGEAPQQDPRAAALRHLADEFTVASDGLLYPLNLSERLTGSWVHAGVAAAHWLRPGLAPNVTASFLLVGRHPAAELGFLSAHGDATLSLLAHAPFPEVPSLQDVIGSLTLHDGAAEAGGTERRLEAQLKGVYAADAGTIILSGGAVPGNVRIEPQQDAFTSPQPPASQRAAAASSASQGGPASDHCDILLTLHLRPNGFDPALAQHSAARMASWHQQQQRAALEQQARRREEATAAPDFFPSLLLSSLFQPRAAPHALAGPAHSSSFSFSASSSASSSSSRSPMLLALRVEDIDGDGALEAVPVASVLRDVDGDGELEVGVMSLASLLSRPRSALLPRRLLEHSSSPSQQAAAWAAAMDAYPGAHYQPLYGHAVSPNCNFTLNLTAAALLHSAPVLLDKATSLSHALLGTGFAHILVTLLQLIASHSQASAQRLSILCIGLQTLGDSWLVVGAFALSTQLEPLAWVALVYFCLFCAFELRLLYSIWKARAADAPANDPRPLQLFQFAAALTLLLGLVWALGLSSLRLLLALLASYWLPQVLHTARSDARHGLTPAYIAVTTAGRAFPLLYAAVCPHSILYLLTPPESRGEALGGWQGAPTAAAHGAAAAHAAGAGPRPVWLLPSGTVPAAASAASAALYASASSLALWLCAWQLALACVLALQSRTGWGPRFFVPYVYLPRKYDYHRAVQVGEGGRLVPKPLDTAAWARPSTVGRGGAGGEEEEQEQEQEQQQQQQQPAAEGGAAGGAPLPPSPPPRPPPVDPSHLSPLHRLLLLAWAWGRRVPGRLRRQAAAWRATWDFFVAGLQQLYADGVRVARRRGGAAWGALRTRLGGRGGGVGGGGGSSSSGAPGSPGSAGGDPPKPWYIAVLEMLGLQGAQYVRVAEGGGGGGVGGGVGDAEAGAGTPSAAVGGGAGPAPGAGAAAVDDAREAELEQLVGVEGQSIDCVVCMDAVDFPMKRRDYCATPCDHLFHTACLMPWLAHKMECPTCR